MRLDRLSPDSTALLLLALRAGELVNVLYRAGVRLEAGVARDRRCFALSQGGWLEFLGWDGRPADGAECRTRWRLSDEASALLAVGVAA